MFFRRSYSGLRMKVLEKYFANGRMKIKCVANLYEAYHRSSEISVDLERPKLAEYETTLQPPSWESMNLAGTYPHTTCKYKFLNFEKCVNFSQFPQENIVRYQISTRGKIVRC